MLATLDASLMLLKNVISRFKWLLKYTKKNFGLCLSILIKFCSIFTVFLRVFFLLDLLPRLSLNNKETGR